jgi:2,5-dioxopentanoate dehydrogenase
MADGAHWIAGEAVTGGETFPNAPVSGEPQHYPKGTPELVDRAVQAAEAAFLTFAETTRAERAALLDAIADQIEARGPAITAIAMAESGLPEARLQGERGRTTRNCGCSRGIWRRGPISTSGTTRRCPTGRPCPGRTCG